MDINVQKKTHIYILCALVSLGILDLLSVSVQPTELGFSCSRISDYKLFRDDSFVKKLAHS
jgi:D-alanyl-lipoteichoic acid acyltransferase DltB (MBOAT superfamily)